MSNLNPTQNATNGWSVGGNDVPMSDGRVKTYPNYASLPAPKDFGVGVAQTADTGNLYKSNSKCFVKFKQLSNEQKLKTLIEKAPVIEDAVMTTPPTITVGADYAGPTESNAVLYTPVHDSMYSPAQFFVSVANWHGVDNYAVKSGDYATGFADTGITAPLTFRTDAQIIELDVHIQPSWGTQMIVDGKRVSDSMIVLAPGAGGAIRKIIKVNFGSIKFRTITIFISSSYAGVWINSKYTIIKPDLPDLTMLTVSHSWEGMGAGYDIPFSMGLRLAHAMGYAGCVNVGAGGSGYTKRGAGGNQKVAYEHLRSFVESGFKPNILFVSTGTNDQSSSNTDAEILAAIDTFYDYVQTNLPDCLCIVVETCVASSDMQNQPRFAMVTDKVKSKLASSTINYIFQNFHNGNVESSSGNVVDNSTIQAVYLNHPRALFTGTTWTGGADSGGNSKLYSDAYPNGHPTGASGAAGLSTGRGYLAGYIFNSVKKALNKMI